MLYLSSVFIIRLDCTQSNLFFPIAAKMINPEDNNVLAMAVGSIAPCVTAPWWEEVLYRGFLLPALTLYLPIQYALPASAILFAVSFPCYISLRAVLNA